MPLLSREHSKAVVFTHFGSLQYGKDDDDWTSRIPKYEQHFAPIIRNYLICAQQTNRLGIVYIYVDSSLKQLFLDTSETGSRGDRIRLLNSALLSHELELLGFLRNLERAVRGELGLNNDELVSIRYIGIKDLLTLLNSLIKVDSRLVEHLSGPGGKFTYDSPKFVEAVIRLARCDLPHLADDPVVRIDEDVKPTGAFFDCLLEQYDSIKTKAPYFFFSGHYSYDGTYRTSDQEEPLSKHFLNDYAVRLHYFVRPGYRSGDNPGNGVRELIRMFLADFDQLGATQFANSGRYYSPALQKLLDSGRPRANERNSAQVISGAGLIMSRRSIDLLPPFMNISQNTVWIDDHLKRRLHETVHDIKPFFPECIDGATIKQERHPLGVTEEDINDSAPEYLERLLRGCLFRRVLSELNDKATTYSQLIEDMVRYRVVQGDEKIVEPRRTTLKSGMLRNAEERYDEVLQCWSQAFYSGTPLHEWAFTRQKDPGHRSTACDDVVEDACKYLGLILQWHIFVRAIQRLDFLANDWVFEETSRSLRR